MDWATVITLVLGISGGYLLTMFVMFKYIMSNAGKKSLEKYIDWSIDVAKEITKKTLNDDEF